jgi:4-amino-4-deoxy-L-arabinose transferase-like glycosyltransferase
VAATKQVSLGGGLFGCAAPGLRKAAICSAGLAALLFALYCVPAILNRPLTETPEARIAVVAREMLQSGDWVVPTLGGERRSFKPPLPYWLAAGTARLLSGGDRPDQVTLVRAVLIPAALCAALAVFVVAIYGSALLGRTAGLLGGMVLGLSYLVLRYAQLGYADAALIPASAVMLCGACSLVCSPRPPLVSALALGLGLGMGILVKEPVPLLVLGGPLAVEVLARRSWSTRKVLLFILAMAVAALVALPWFAALAQRSPGGWLGLMTERQGMWQAGHEQSDRWVYYLYRLAGGMAPWTPLLLCAWAAYLLSLRRERRASAVTAVAAEPGKGDASQAAALRFLALAFGLGFLAFYLSPKQQEHYLLPVLPPLALVAGQLLSRFHNPGGHKEEWLAWSQVAIGALGAVALASVPLWGAKAGALSEVGWRISLPAGGVFLVLHLYLARQWVEGRPLRAAGALAAAALVGALAWSVHWTMASRQTVGLYVEAPRLKAELSYLGAQVRIYAVGLPVPLVTFYLEQPVRTLGDLAREDAGQAGPGGPRRALVLKRRSLAGKLGACLLRSGVLPWLATDLRQHLVVVLPPEIDWPQQARELLGLPPAREGAQGER